MPYIFHLRHQPLQTRPDKSLVICYKNPTVLISLRKNILKMVSHSIHKIVRKQCNVDIE